MRTPTLLASLLALVLVLPVSAAGALEHLRETAEQSAAAQEAGFGSDNFQLIKNLPHAAGGRGSDIEFATFTYDDADAAAAAGFTTDPAADAIAEDAGIQKDIAIAGTTGNLLYLYDVTDPENTYLASAYNCRANQGDSQVFTRTEDGVEKTFITYTVEDSSAGAIARDQGCALDMGLEGSASGTFIIEITDPFSPVAVAHIPVPEGSHNGSVHPSGDYFYNSNSRLIVDTDPVSGPSIEYYDISDFDSIERLGSLVLPLIPASLGTESHDITFNAEGDRAYSAALSQGVVIDTSDPAAPSIISNFVDPSINVWHQSDPITIDGREFLVVEDEVAGAIGTGQCPNGGVHVFEITGDLENTPVKVGYWNIDEARVMGTESGVNAAGGCTAHVFRLHPDAGVMTISYYNGGVRVVDLRGLVGINVGGQGIGGVTATVGGVQDPMVQIGWRRFADSNSWAAKSPRISRDADGNLEPFAVFSNGGRGLDVLGFDGTVDEAAVAASEWLTPAQAELQLPVFTAAQLRANPQYVCFL